MDIVHLPAHLAREAHYGSVPSDGLVGQGADAPAGQRFGKREEVAGAGKAVFIVRPSQSLRSCRPRLTQIG